MTSIRLKLIFRRLLIKLATECTFKFNSKFLKQVDGCTLGGPLSVTFSDIYMVRMENDAVISSKPIFYHRFVGGIYSRQRLGESVLFYQLNNYHPNIKLTIEVNPSKFLDSKLTNINGAYNSTFIGKNAKLSSSWKSKTPKRYKRNTINGDFHRSKRISSNSDEEIPLIKKKFIKAGYPLRFINSVVSEFQKGKKCGDVSFIISPSFFEITKPFIFVEIPYCELNEIKSKHFLKKFHKFTNNSFRIVITWKTRNIRSLFPLKDKNDYKLCIYAGVCSCGLCYIGETKRNAEVRWNEHNNPTKSSEPSKHLRSNINHYFTWTVISNAPKGAKTNKS